MKKKVTISILLVISIILIPFIYIEIKKNSYRQQIQTYLAEEKGYELDEIQLIQGKYHPFGLPKYWVTVVFKNEPNIEYAYFTNHAKGQFEYYNTYENTVPPIETLKNYDPSDR
jgi:ABC-type cobalt transport system substrate-binding protein